jgi:chromosome segregation ATPase
MKKKYKIISMSLLCLLEVRATVAHALGERPKHQSPDFIRNIRDVETLQRIMQELWANLEELEEERKVVEQQCAFGIMERNKANQRIAELKEKIGELKEKLWKLRNPEAQPGPKLPQRQVISGSYLDLIQRGDFRLRKVEKVDPSAPESLPLPQPQKNSRELTGQDINQKMAEIRKMVAVSSTSVAPESESTTNW